jgi:predicted ATPase
MRRITSLQLGGYKSIGALPELAFGECTVLIGANAAGKSNLLSFFRLLNWLATPPGLLQLNVARLGGGNGLLHGGAKITKSVRASLGLILGPDENDTRTYGFELEHAVPDTLIFTREDGLSGTLTLPRDGRVSYNGDVSRAGGLFESRLLRAAEDGNPRAEQIAALFRGIGYFHFHDTSETARIRQRWAVDDARQLKEDAGNLAPFLYRLARERPAHYSRITEMIRQVVPQFADFVLGPDNGRLLLQWRESGSDLHFGPGQASDGTLRVMALLALLLQPPENLPPVVVIDEPELGLHPSAIHLVAGLLLNASQHTQVIVATQSPALLDHFEPEQIVVVDRPERESIFRRLDSEQLAGWLDEYTLAELWEKNVLGGKPA